MKPSFEAVAANNTQSFLVRKFEERYFSAPYHYHPEYELTLILQGNGKRYIGSHMQDYDAGDLVLLGANLPHCWKTGENALENSCSVVIHFTHDFMGKEFLIKPEIHVIAGLLSNSNYGLHFTGDTTGFTQLFLNLLEENDPFLKWMRLLEILYTLASAQEYSILDKQQAFTKLSSFDKERINEVMAYIVNNFQQKIMLSEAAASINMTPHAFCKYFKKITRKTFIEAVNDYRIDYAINQLISSDKSVSKVGFESGFNDISHFYKKFRQRFQVSPFQYRNNFARKLM